MMVIQYPQVLTVTVSGGATKNANGDWVKHFDQERLDRLVELELVEKTK